MKEIADFARLLEVRRGGAAPRLRAARPGRPAVSRGAGRDARGLRPLPRKIGRLCTWKPAKSRPTRCCDFIRDVERDNLFVNFDPANMILYGSGEPIAALKKIGRYVHSVHCKDATWAAHPGQEWGAEVPLGEGDVGMEAYLRTLDAIGYHGPLTIEREIPQEPERQKAEIGRAIQLLRDLKAKIG